MVAKRDKSTTDGWSADYAKKVFGIAGSFVRHLYEREVLEKLPRNLGKKEYRFSRPTEAIEVFTNEEISELLSMAKGQQRLHLLLMLNCGFNQIDVSDLLKSQIDLERATITGRRSKTGRNTSTPLVCYPLWKETTELLREHMAKEGERALLTHSGRPWVRKETLANGRLKKADNIATNYRRLRAKVGIIKSLKVFRKTSATRLRSHSVYRDLRFYFLGHSTRNLADKHYAKESPQLLAEAVAWLREQFQLP